MRTLAVTFPILLLSALTAVRSAISDTPIFEKGQDIRPLLEHNERLRAEALRAEMQKRELRKNAYLAMRLTEPAEECVAHDPAARSCLISVEDFNKTLEAWDFGERDQDPEFPSFEDAKREKAALLKSLLDEKYLESYSPDGQSRDSLNRLFDSARSDRVHAFRARQGDSAFRALYARHFTRLFQGKEARQYQALATSDSALADSLRQAPSQPWRPLAEDDLPPELMSAATALQPGEMTRPIKTPYGHVILRLHSVRRIPDQRFEEAMPVLISLLHTPSGQDQRLEESVAAYYSRNAADFTAADTVQYRTWLFPEGKRKIGVTKVERIREDTSKVKPITVHHHKLPSALREELELYRPVQVGELLGPIRSLFGIWYFQPLEIQTSNRRLSLAEASPRIRELLFGKTPLSPETVALQEAEAKDRDLWKSLVRDYLLQKTSEGPKPANAYQKLEQDKEDWMRNRLQIRLVEWAGYAPTRENKTKDE